MGVPRMLSRLYKNIRILKMSLKIWTRKNTPYQKIGCLLEPDNFLRNLMLLPAKNLNSNGKNLMSKVLSNTCAKRKVLMNKGSEMAQQNFQKQEMSNLKHVWTHLNSN